MGKNIEKQNLAKILLEQGFIDNILDFTEVNESCGNQVFCTEKLFIKVSTDSDNLQTEYNVLLLSNSLHIPKAVFYKKVTDSLDVYYILGVSRIKGKTLEHDWENMKFEEKNNLIIDVISCIKYINNLEIRGGIQSIYENWINLIDNGEYKNNPHLDTKLLQYLITKTRTFLESIKDEIGYLVHNDIWYKNILVENNRFSGIIDFESSYLAPMRFEYYGLLLTNYYVFATECGDSGEFEREFCKMLSNSIKNIYKELVEHSCKEEFICFCIIAYLKKLGQYEEDWYNHEEVMYFMDKIEVYAKSIFDGMDMN